jgi:hypothetical protein
MTTDPLGTFRDDLVDAASAAQPRRRRRAVTAVAGAAAVAVVATVVSVQSTDPSGRDEEVVAGGPPTTARPGADDGQIPSGPVWSIAAPAGWRRAGAELLTDLGPPSLTLATISLSDAAGGSCASVPTEALARLGSEDSLVSVVFYGPKAVDAPAWPEGGFDDSVFPPGQGTAGEACELAADVEVHHGRWSRGGQGLGVVVAFGTEVTPARRADAWAALSSLQPERGNAASPPTCVVTRPREPGLAVPEAWPERPSAGVWYGTPDLWTVLPTDGSSPTPRKSVWWSARFLGGAREPTPDVNVTWERLDEPAPIVQVLGQGTNASTAAEGSFMIAGGDPLTAGCWSVTASYRGTNLTYVYWSEPGIWAAETPTDVGDGAGIEGTVHFDEDRNCVVLRDDGGALHSVVWPAGTVTDDGAVALADGTTVGPGDRVLGAGGMQPIEDQLRTSPQGCMPDPASWVDDTGEVFVMWRVSRTAAAR